MARHDPSLFHLARYAHRTELYPRFGDLDPFRHVNNAAMASLLEEARARFNRASGFVARPPEFGMVVASITLDYLAEATYPAPLAIGTALTDIGRTSFVKLQLVVQEGRPVAFGRAIMVNLVDGVKAPFTDERRASLDPWLLHPAAESLPS